MLKLKDDVDLKELEKFGFRKHKRDDEDILTSKWTREWVVEDHLDGWETGGGWLFYSQYVVKKDRKLYFVGEDRDFNLEDNLTQAGLVEKVVEDE